MKKFVTCTCGHPQWWHRDARCRYGCACTEFQSQDTAPPYPPVPKAPDALPDATGDPYETDDAIESIQQAAVPRVWIERLLYDNAGHVRAVDLHDETNGEAIFCEAVNRHFHGRYGDSR